MSGGENAEFVACTRCAEQALRMSEGIETNWYLCASCGNKFGIDWSYDGPPDVPQWPPTKEQVEAIKRMAKLLDAT